MSLLLAVVFAILILYVAKKDWTEALIRWCIRHSHGMPRIIEVNGKRYLMRYFLFRHSASTEGMDGGERPARWGLYLHRFLRGDEDRELHNHPWRWAVSLVLKTGYSEERRVGNEVIRRYVKPWTLNFIRGTDFHRVDLTQGEAWTLFLVGPIVQEWGFWSRTTGVFTPWKKFLGIAEDGQ